MSCLNWPLKLSNNWFTGQTTAKVEHLQQRETKYFDVFWLEQTIQVAPIANAYYHEKEFPNNAMFS